MKYFPSPDLPFQFFTFWIFAGMVLVQLVYTILYFGRFAYSRKKQANTAYPPVSIVIAARNESDNLFNNLPKLLTQDYPAEFEVVVVNHQSIDDSRHLLSALQREHRNLSVLEMERSRHQLPSKKLPLTLGIKRARFEHLVLTDADCYPESNQWLKKMVGNFDAQKEVVLGYGPYPYEKGFLNKIIRFDTAMIAVNYFSQALNGNVYMGVGRNMAYTRTLFNSVGGFKSHYSISSGDDDLFVQQAAKKKNTALEIDPDTFMFSEPKHTWSDWVRQKRRHFTTAPQYRVFKKLLLGIYPLTMWLLLVSFVILVCEPEWRIHAGAGLGLTFVLKWWLLGKSFSRLKEPGFIALMPFLDLFYIVGMPFLYYSTVKKNNGPWK